MTFAICRWVPDFSDSAIQQLAQEGVTAVEPGPDFLYRNSGSTTGPEAGKLRRAGIRIYSCHAPFEKEDDLSILDEAKRKATVERHKVALSQTAAAGGEVLVIHPSTGVKAEEREKRREKLIASLDQLVPAAERSGVKLALENMIPNYIGQDASSLRSLIAHYASPFLRVCFDTGHANLCQEGIHDCFDAVKDLTIVMHLHDNDGHQDRHLQPPYGIIDWNRLCRQIEECGYAYPLSIETPPWAKASWAMQLREIEALFSGRVMSVQWNGRTVRMICERCRHFCISTDNGIACACSS